MNASLPDLTRLRALIFFVALFCFATAAESAIRVTTWNLEWFPNSSPDETSPAAQAARIRGAADVLRSLNPDIILLQEIKDYDAVAQLAEAIKPKTYKVAICSAFRERDEIGKQQVAILAKENAQAAWAEPWVSLRGVDPPRGFAFAWFKINGQDVGVYSVHLKSNRLAGKQNSRTAADEAGQTAQNIAKREVSIEQILTHVREVIGKKMPMVRSIIVGGDFNTNRDNPDWAKDTTLAKFKPEGFTDAYEGLAPALRVTHPASGSYPPATFDYLFYKNATAKRPIITLSKESDHLPVSCDLELSKNTGATAVAAVPANTPVAPPESATSSPAPGTAAANSATQSATPAAAPPTQDIRVWVHVPTKLYFRPGAALYGRTNAGMYMKESEAVQAGYKPAAVK